MSETSPSTNASAGGQTDERSRVSRAAHLLAAMTLVSRVAGLARDAAISAVFGTGLMADAFFVAFRIPNLFRRVVAEGAASTAFVPVFTESLVAGGKPAAVRAAAAVGGVAVVVLCSLTLVGMLASGFLTDLFAPGFSSDATKEALTASLTCWTFPYLVLVGVAAWAMGVHHTLRSFALPAVGPVVMNLSIIVFALGVAPLLAAPVWALVGGVLVGGALQVAVQVPSLWRQGFRPAMFAAWTHPAVRRCGRLVLPAVFGGSVYQVNVLLGTVFASLLPAGTVSYLWYADRLFEFPLGVVAVAVGTAALPSLSSQAAAGRTDAMGETVVHAMGLTVAFCLPAAVGLAMLAPEITALLFERGSFDAHDTAMTAWALAAGAPGLLGVGLARVLSSAFFALERTRIPVLVGVATMALNVVLSMALMGPVQEEASWWGASVVETLGQYLAIANLRHAGLSLATGLSATINAAVLLWALHRVLPRLPLAALARSVFLHSVATLGMALMVASWCSVAVAWFGSGAAGPVVAGAVTLGGATYLVLSSIFGSSEIRELLGALTNRQTDRNEI